MDESIAPQHRRTAETLLKESDRGCVIFSAALLDESLEELLRAACRQNQKDIKASVDPLFKGYAPFSSFSAKIEVAFALGLLTEDLHRKIDLVRRLRNDFAHNSGPIDFGDPRCASRLELVMDQELAEQIEVGFADLMDTPVAKRLWFVMSVVRMIGRMQAYSELAREGKNVRQITTKLDEQTEAGLS